MRFEYYENAVLPPRQMRCGGREYHDNEFYLKSARAEADRLIDIGLTADMPLLDVGCGQGRLAIGLLDRVGEMKHYRGIDVRLGYIEWCQEFITRKHPGFQFVLVDARNERYSPKGRLISKAFRFPFEGEEFDIIYLFSLFTHMVAEDVRIYLAEFRRLLSPSGKIFFNAFIEKSVSDMTINPKGYQNRRWSGKLHCVLYSKDFFESMLAESEFKIDSTKKVNGSKGIYISRKK